MAGQALILISVLAFILCVVFLPGTHSTTTNFFDDDDSPTNDYNDYLDSDLERILYITVKRDNGDNSNNNNSNNNEETCIVRGGSCDDRPNECCNYTACRCNLWGGNCRCQRRALFQKWGK